MKAMEIYDNITPPRVEDGLNKLLTTKGVTRADFCVGYFNLRGWSIVSDAIEALPGETVQEMVGEKRTNVHRICRLLVGMHRQPAELIQLIYQAQLAPHALDNAIIKALRKRVVEDFRKQLTLGFPTASDEQTLRTLCGQLKCGKVTVKANLGVPLHAKLYLAHHGKDSPTPVIALMGSSNLTFGGLSRNGELNATFPDPADATRFATWFEERWKDRGCLDITQELIEILEGSWAGEQKPTPYEIYLRIMYGLSLDARQGLAEYKLSDVFEKTLFDYQKTAVKLLLQRLDKRRGAMLGDVVGLGKTMAACAVAQYYEHTAWSSTLVLCPPKLIPMWEHHKDLYNLKMKVASMAGSLKKLEEKRFRLIVIDESHNLRSGEGQRYTAIKEFIQQRDEAHVLLMTATPYNKEYRDIGMQLGLFLSGDEDLGVRPEEAIKAAGGEMAFVRAHANVLLSSLNAFLESECSNDWKDLLKHYLVRRTRTFIKQNYAHRDENDSRYYLLRQDGTRDYFPERVPKSVTFETKPGDLFERLYNETMMDLLGNLRLPRYGLANHLDHTIVATAGKADRAILDGLTSAGHRLMGFCRSGFCKRLDSSGVVFLTSLYRHAVRNAMFLYAIDNALPLPLRADMELDEGWEEDEVEPEKLELVFSTDPKVYAQAGADLYRRIEDEHAKNVRWLPTKYFKPSLAKALVRDNKDILKMLSLCDRWNPAKDEKLNALERLLTQTHPSDKVLIFTQYADTARYIYDQLRRRGIQQIAEIDGGTENATELVCRFSPVSNNEKSVTPLRILIATDALSEGQNLQDAHIVINYDLPWAIIRLIQRAGRVDRIGQRAPEVWCYSFFPQEGIEKLIKLTDRLKQRFKENADTIGSDEVFFEGTAQNLTDVYSEKVGVLDDTDDNEVDLASQAYQIWENATKDNPDLAQRIQSLPLGAYSGKTAAGNAPGAIVYAKSTTDNDVLLWMDADGKPHPANATDILEALACTPETPKQTPLPKHFDLVNEAVMQLNDASAANPYVGVFGSKSTTRYRLFDLLQTCLKEDPDGLFAQQYTAIANLIYAAPLRETAKYRLTQLIRAKVSREEILNAALDLYENDALCIPRDNEAAPTLSAHAVCSLSLVE